MPEEATKLMVENINKNIVDQEEYPAAQIIHNRCVSMSEWNRIFHDPDIFD
jgi:glutamate decarboxylase